MKLQLDATPEELRDKGPDLIKAITNLLAEHNPEIAEALEKALPQKEKELKYPVLQHLHDESTKAYLRLTGLMIGDIEKVLRSGLEKAYDHTKEIADKDAVAYAKVQEILTAYGYGPADYQEGGRLYGMSVNELIDKIKELRSDTDS